LGGLFILDRARQSAQESAYIRRPMKLGFTIVSAALLVATTAVAGEDAAAFFRGKTVSYIVATGAGGGYDTYGRLLTRYMQKHMPGTRFIVRNVPGGGHLVGANLIYSARADGLTIGTFNTGLIYAQLLEQSGVRFDLSRMSWIGKMADEGRTLLIANNSGIRDVREMMNAPVPIKLAASGIGSASYIEMRILADVLNLNIRLVTGFEGAETQLSMLRGEVAGVLNTASTHEDFVRRGEGKFVVAIAGASSGIPGVPAARDFVRDADGLKLLALVETLAELGRLTAGPPDIPPDRVAYLRDRFTAAVNDPALAEEMRRLNAPLRPGGGEEVAAKVRSALLQAPATIALLRRAAQ
jgi:tripartite-type tricarboxylate transporter receptor subunit TctC